MNIQRKCYIMIAVIFLLWFSGTVNSLQAKEPALLLKIDGLEDTFLEEKEQGDYRIYVTGEPLKRITGTEFPALRDLDIKLQNKEQVSSQLGHLSNALLIAMARIADQPTLIYLHELFESHPQRRNDVAQAICWYAKENRRRDPDWRILVRSLNVVEGAQARDVMEILTKFRRRSNKAQWIRQVILVGLQQNAKGQETASKLLTYWTGTKLPESDQAKQFPMLFWQKWFAKKYPDELEAQLPVEAKDSRWKYSELMSELKKRPEEKLNLKSGVQSFTKATCIKCHRFGKIGEKVGPDLTTVSRRLQQKEILLATMFPSHFIPEEYPTFTVVTDAGKVFTGMLGAAGPKHLLILSSEGTKQKINKNEVETIIPVKKSSMPEGLLNLLSKKEAVELIRYLGTLPEGAPATFHHKKQ